MSEQQVRVLFEPHGRAVMVLPGTKIVEAAGQAGLVIDSPCGGQGLCGKCRVRITGGGATTAPDGQHNLSPEELSQGWRLACQTAITTACTIHIPEASLFGSGHQILAQRQRQASGDVAPAIRKLYVEMAPPTLQDCDADLLRLEKKIGPIIADLDVLRRLPTLLRHGNFKGTAVLTDHHLIDFEAGDTTAHCHGMAFDIGTTTIVGSLLDLTTGDEKAIAAGINPQVNFGDDVLSRIQHSGSCDDCLTQLRKSILGAVITLIDTVCREANISRRDIYEVTFAGNTTMQHLLCGIEATQLGQVPFAPAYARGLLLNARDLELPIHPRGMAYLFPVIGGFVGGDTVAGILSTRLPELEGPVLMVDIGTNGEIVLAHNGQLLAASTAAGPAFEGARISCGMRAANGAIEKVSFADGDIRAATIANAPAIGLCGSGLIDLAAELLRQGIISPEGRLLPADELPPAVPPALRARVLTRSDGQTEFLMTADGDRRLTLTQRDVRELQLAGGAIRAGIAILLKRAGLATADLTRILIAGGFGSFIRRSNAQRIGLLPTDVHHERITYVGNASLDGAKAALLSTGARQRGEDLARQALHVELSQDANFQMEFAEAMIFPEK